MLGSQEAIFHQQTAVTIFERAAGLCDSRTAQAYTPLADLYSAIADYPQAIALTKRAIMLFYLCAGPNRNEFVPLLQRLSALYLSHKCSKAAALVAEVLVAKARKLYGEHDLQVAEA